MIINFYPSVNVNHLLAFDKRFEPPGSHSQEVLIGNCAKEKASVYILCEARAHPIVVRL